MFGVIRIKGAGRASSPYAKYISIIIYPGFLYTRVPDQRYYVGVTNWIPLFVKNITEYYYEITQSGLFMRNNVNISITLRSIYINVFKARGILKQVPSRNRHEI